MALTEQLESVYADIVFGHDEPVMGLCTWSAYVYLLWSIGELVPEIAAPCGPGFSVQ